MIHEKETFRKGQEGTIAYAHEDSEAPGPPATGWRSGANSETTTWKVTSGARQENDLQNESTEEPKDTWQDYYAKVL